MGVIGQHRLLHTSGFLTVMAVATLAVAQEHHPQRQEDRTHVTESKPASEPPFDETHSDGSEDLSELSLEELMNVQVVVTAARREQKIATVPYAISVITAEDIRRSGARSVPDALRLVPGVDVADLSFGNAAVSPRGFHGMMSNQVLVLVDGRQIFDSIFGGTLWGAWPFQMEDIERIEVIRGPGGVTWGANAVNGVINIITKDPADQLGLTLTAGGGSRGTFKKHVGYGSQDGKLRLRISGEYEASDGFHKGGSFLRSLDDDYKGGRIGFHAVYQAGPRDVLTISGGSGVVDGGYPPTPLAGFGLRRNSGSQASFLLGKWAHRVAHNNRVELTAFVNDFHLSPGLPSIDYRYQQFAFQFSHTLKPTEAHIRTWGIDSRVDLVDTTNADPFMLRRDRISTAVIGAYLHDEWRFAPKWTLNLGSRIDYESYGGFQPSARIALSRELPDNSMIYGAVSRAFQMHPAAARFVDTPMFNGLVRVKGDRDVDAETLVAYEFGHRGEFFGRLRTSVNLFWNEFDDLTTISPILGPPALIRLDLGNRASASMYGIELEANFKATERLTLFGHYTYQQLDWRSPVPFHDKDLISAPRHKFMLGAGYSPTDDLHFSSHLYYVDAVKAPNPSNPFVPRHVDPYFRLDLRGEYEFWNDQASIAVGVRNLLDPNHYEGGTLFLNDAEVPRMIYVEFRTAIK